MHRGALGPGLAPSNSVLGSCSVSWKGCSCSLTPHLHLPPAQLQGTGLETLLELLEMKPDLESRRERELGSNGPEQKERAGMGPGEPWGRGEGVA